MGGLDKQRERERERERDGGMPTEPRAKKMMMKSDIFHLF